MALSVLVQAGHEGRTSGATGAVNSNYGWEERYWTPIVADAASDWLVAHGASVIRENADFNQTYNVDYAVFLHFDGSINPFEDDASIGYSIDNRGGSDDLGFASTWKSYYEQMGWNFGWNDNNYTENLSQYYGYSYATNAVSELVIEFGTMTNNTAAVWLSTHLEQLGQWVGQAIFLDYYGYVPPDDLSDLIVENLTVDSTSWADGDTVAAFWDLKNIGGLDADSSQSTLYISTDATISTSDSVLLVDTSSGTVSPGEVNPEGEPNSFTFDATGFAPGTYYVGVLADSGSDVSESGEDNNVSNVIQITVDGGGVTLIGGSLGDKIVGTSGSDTLYGNGGADKLIGRGGADHLDGGSGRDKLKGGYGNDNLLGGRGPDRFVFQDNGSADQILDFADLGRRSDDVIDLRTFNFANSDSITKSALGNDLVLDLGGGSSITLADYLSSHSVAAINDDFLL